MTAPVENIFIFAITTFSIVLVFAVIPTMLLIIAGLLLGTIASFPMLAVASLTRLVSRDPPTGDPD